MPDDSSPATLPPEAPPPAVHPTPTVAVLGNPNAGKTTIFNRLTGLRQKVGNYPGVTVERKEGALQLGSLAVRLLDLPGTYSMAAHSPDEMVAVDVLLGHQEGERRPDLVLLVVDASNLERNLYLLSQVRELGVPVVMALNMMDVAERHGVRVDPEALSRSLELPVVPTRGQRGDGIAELREAIGNALASRGVVGPRMETPVPLPDDLERALHDLREWQSPLAKKRIGRDLHRFEILRALVDKGGHAEKRFCDVLGPTFRTRLLEARSTFNGATPLASLEAQARYSWVSERTRDCATRAARETTCWTERIDRVLTHRVLGPIVFATMMLLVFQSIFTYASPLMDLIDGSFAALGAFVGSALPEGMLRSLVVDGVIAGVGAVVIFLPQILILFLFIGLLEDCGYMARAAFIVDKVMSRCGLSGKSFIPMLSGFACAVPGIMAARVIENRRDRIATILVTPLMSCSARLPVYAILIGTFIPNTSLLGGLLGLQAATLFGLYLLGLVMAIAMAWLFKKTLLRGSTPPFVLELPSYKWPALTSVALRLYDRGKAFLLRAGTIILAITIVVWGLAYFPHGEEVGATFEARREQLTERLDAAGNPEVRQAIEEEIAALDRAEAGTYLRQSFFGRMGRSVEPVFRPLGWDWKISMAAIASFPAREVVVSTLGTIYNIGDDVDESSGLLGERLREETSPETGEPVFTIPTALSIMVFFALCCQCGATVATIKRETNSWGWAWFTFAYMTLLAYAGAFLTYQVGSRLSW